MGFYLKFYFSKIDFKNLSAVSYLKPNKKDTCPF